MSCRLSVHGWVSMPYITRWQIQNYPWNLNLSPLVGAIAAGCPVVMKVYIVLYLRPYIYTQLTFQPSELAPASSALLADLLPKYLDPEAFAVINGAVDHTTKLMEKQWGHGEFIHSVYDLWNLSWFLQCFTPDLDVSGNSSLVLLPRPFLPLLLRWVLFHV